ncbi:MAG: hypothetical protein Q9224_001002 [Gallowayella concinna]
MWGKAKAAEKNRIKHVEEGVSLSRVVDISSDEAVESDEGLFISQDKSSRKRAHAEIINDGDFDDANWHETGGSSGERDVVDILGLEEENASRMRKKAPSKRQAAKARGKWALKGMSSTLYHYQVQRAAWMKLRETGDIAPFGGILADQMGLRQDSANLSMHGC